MVEHPVSPVPAGRFRHVPVVALADPRFEAIVRSGAERAGGGASVAVAETIEQLAPIGRADVIVASGTWIDPLETLVEAERMGGLGIPALSIGVATPISGLPEIDDPTLALLADDRLAGLNVPVPSIDDDRLRARIWDQLRSSRIEERHHLVEVDGRPALGPTVGAGTDDPGRWGALAAGAAGVLAGRLAASNRRWQRQLDG